VAGSRETSQFEKRRSESHLEVTGGRRNGQPWALQELKNHKKEMNLKQKYCRWIRVTHSV